MKTRKVEYLIAFDDQTWDTICVDVPYNLGYDREKLVNWAEMNLPGQARFGNVVLFALYNVS